MNNIAEKDLNDGIAKLEKRIARLEAKDEIQNLMGRFSFLQSSARYAEIMAELFSRRKDRSYEDGSAGVYTDDKFSPELILSYFKNRYGCLGDGDSGEALRGNLVVNALTSPVIAVSDDGESADGIWITSGHETIVLSQGESSGIASVDEQLPDENGRRHQIYWVWQKYEVHFIKEDGEWRILNMHVYDLVKSPFKEDWVEYAEKRYVDDETKDSDIRFGGSPTHATYPTTSHWQYSPDAFASDIPKL